MTTVEGVAGTETVYVGGGGVWRSDDLGATWFEKYPQVIQTSLEIAPTDAQAIWAGGETVIFRGYTVLSTDGGATWKTGRDSRFIGDNQPSDICAHPLQPGLTLTGHEGFILKTGDSGFTFQEVLNAEVRFFIDWDGANPARAYAGGSPNGGTAQLFVIPDLGSSWSPITAELAPRTVYRVEADHRRLGVAGLSLATIDPPEPAPGHALGILVRPAGSSSYGTSSDGLPRIPSFGDCP